MDQLPNEVQLFGIFDGESRPQLLQSVVHSAYSLVDLLHEGGKETSNSFVEDSRQLSGKNGSSEDLAWDGGVDWVAGEEFLFFFDCDLDFNVVVDVLLRSQFNSNVAVIEGDIFSSKHFEGISALIHDVYFGEDTNGSDSVGVELLGHQ